MTAVLGIDAAWTAGQPSGVALVEDTGSGWRCRGLAPSYGQFVALAAGGSVDWAVRPAGGLPVLAELLASASALLGGRRVDVVAVDMPLATVAITGRRSADTQISRQFGGRGCSTHSPNVVRPGPVATSLVAQGVDAGLPLATSTTPVGTLPALLEVYPHTALLSLTGAPYRLCYKASRVARYWPDISAADRRVQLVATWCTIKEALTGAIADIDVPFPDPGVAAALGTTRLKRYEDALDAVICAWVGTRYVAGDCRPYGDPTGAIWTPE